MVILEDNLVDIAKPGDDVMISGILIEVAILANNVTVQNKREFNIKQEINKQACSDFKKYWKSHEKNQHKGKNEIIESICPHIYDRYPEKLGLLLAIIGGVPKQSGNDPRIRGQIHMLMIGEPGTGKSQLLNFA
jgi:DNA helicase MCM9